MRFRTTPDSVIAFDAPRDRWVDLRAAAAAAPQVPSLGLRAPTDLIGLLAGGEPAQVAVASLLEAVGTDPSVTADPSLAGLPFNARSMRAFMVYEDHVIDSARVLVKRFFPKVAGVALTSFERATRQTFPPLKPNRRFFEVPAFYIGSHAAMLADGEPMWWPSHTEFLDFELELACVIAQPLSDATPAEARAAIGGWFVLNDGSARDVQAQDYRTNVFGPVVKAKTFANAIGCDVVTPDELGDWRAVTGRVRVDGEPWCEGSTAGSVFDIGEMIAHASKGEYLAPGDVFSTGTMPGCCGLELDRWVQPGQTLELEIDGIGTLTSTIDEGARPRASVAP
jgi:2-keto-4-pentenoate hydratase/2-oxohepta-3-ene-1,7-dioic acid hydratase in catechol pathway